MRGWFNGMGGSGPLLPEDLIRGEAIARSRNEMAGLGLASTVTSKLGITTPAGGFVAGIVAGVLGVKLLKKLKK